MTSPPPSAATSSAVETLPQRNLRAARLVAVLTAILVPSGIALDVLTNRDELLLLGALRAGAALFALLVLRLTYLRGAERYAYALGAAPVLGAAVFLEIMILRLGGYSHPYTAGLSQCILALGVIFYWRVREILLACSVILLIWLVPALAGGNLEAGPFANHLFALTITAAIAVASNANRYKALLRETGIREELADALAKLRELDRWKSQFFANITHELRTPLTMILAPVESMLTGDFGPLTPVQRSYLEANWRNGVRLLKLINDLLDLAKMGEGFLRLRPEPTDVEALLKEIVAYSRPLAARKKLGLELVVKSKPADFRVDAEKLERALVNLISNALKFTETGAVTVILEADGGPRGQVRVTVEDTGIGIPAETIPTLFQRFSQGDAAVTRRFGGTGLGLAYAKEIIELHGGRITVESTPDVGSRFTIHLKDGADSVPEKARDRRQAGGRSGDLKRRDDQEPVEWALKLQRQLDYRFAEIDQVTDRRLVSRPQAAPTTSTRILVVEDNVEILELINLQLRDKYAVLVAQNGVQGLEVATRERPDIIVTDFMMPEMDGLTMIKKLRAVTGLAETPVIMLTARNQLEDRLSAREAGADIYLEKPFSARELEASIKQFIQKQGRQVQSLMRAHVEGLEIVSAGLAHEIHNPLNFIKNANLLIAENVEKIRVILADLATVHPEAVTALDKAQGRIDRMVQSSTRGVERIEKVVALIRRYAREGYPTEPTDLEFDTSVAEVVELVAPRADMEGRVTQDLQAPGHLVRAIPEELNQVIRSLVQNACESVGPTGRVHVRTRWAAGAPGTQGQVVLEVVDNGPGIAPDNVAKIFAPFFTTKDGTGRGMGLAIVQIVINRIGGTVEVTSVQGVETTFRLKLPVVGQAAALPLAAAAAAAAAP
jgi:signal transduction histidine kinase